MTRLALLLLLLVHSIDALAEQSLFNKSALKWALINNNNGYSLRSSEAGLSGTGSSLRIESVKDMTGNYGGAIATFDASTLHGKVIFLSAKLSAGSGTNNTALWMRIDGKLGKLKFATSADKPILTTGEAQERAISLMVPSDASTLVLGLVISGNGWADATNMRALVMEPSASTPFVDAEMLLDAAIQYARVNSVRTRLVDWESASRQLHSMEKDSEDTASA